LKANGQKKNDPKFFKKIFFKRKLGRVYRSLTRLTQSNSSNFSISQKTKFTSELTHF